VGNTVTINSAVNVDGGGALYADGGGGDVIDIRRTVIANNSVTLSPSTAVNGGGGGIFSGGGQVTLVNDTLSNNSLSVTGGGDASDGGGGLFNYGPGTFTNDTIASNTTNTRGGGVFANGATQTLKNTIASLNSAPAGTNCAGATSVSSGNNLEDANSCNLTQPTDHKNTAPLLGPLQDNGGSTLTRALLAGSPAIDAGDNSACPGTDQRGVPRPQPPGGKCDIGAFERVGDGSAPTIAITTPPDGAHYKQGQKVLASYSCSDPDGPQDVVLCQGPAQNGKPIDTGTVGKNSFIVQATDRAGNSATKTVRYTVDTTEASPPTIKGLPPQGGCVPRGLKLKISVHPRALRRAAVFFDGRRIGSSAKADFKVRVPASKIKPGRHKVRILRVYKSGTKRRSTFTFVRCRHGGRSPHVRTQGTPDRGTCTAEPFSILVTIKHAKPSTILVKLDGKSFAKPGKIQFTLSIDVTKLRAGGHVLKITAADKFKNGAAGITHFVRCA
jgi:hypothetical protein